MGTTRKSSKRSTVLPRAASGRKVTASGLGRLIREYKQEKKAIGKLLARGAARRPLPEYARVVAIGESKEVSEVRGRTGIVLDAAELGGRWTYTVLFPALGETFVLPENSLWDSGETVPED